jgi:hypothetical protein
MNDHLDDYTSAERARFEALPRTAALDPRLEDSIVAELRRDGRFARPRPRAGLWIATALAAGLIVAAWIGGVRYGSRSAQANSIEAQLRDTTLDRNERVLLMQRAGSAYVTAAHQYASSVAKTDSLAIQVASQVLLGAAQAVARTDLEGGVASQVAGLMRDTQRRQTKVTQTIWY